MPDDARWSRGGDGLAAVLADAARSLEGQRGLADTMDAGARTAVSIVPGCDEASISLVTGRRRITSMSATGDLAKRLDAAQHEAGEGPCLDAALTDHPILQADLSTGDRWPRFTARAHDLGVKGVLAFRLYVAGATFGALNCYATRAGALTEDSVHIGELCATHVGLAYAGARKNEAEVRRTASRELIGQAQGILMERHKIGPTQSFDLLVTASQRSNTKLVEVASWLVHSGQLDMP